MNAEPAVDNTAGIRDLLIERLAPARPAGTAYSIDRQADINDIRAALDDPGIIRLLADVLIEQQRLVREQPTSRTLFSEIGKNQMRMELKQALAWTVWFLSCGGEGGE